MARPLNRIRLVACGAVAASVLAALAPAAQSATPVDAHLQGTFAMKGTITRADNVKGEQKGDSIKRTWKFQSKCARDVPACKTVTLRRERSAHHVDKLVLTHDGTGSYSGKGKFYFALRCAGKTYDQGGEARVKIALKITRAATVKGEPFATKVTSEYSNPKRINHTPCGGDLGHDAASYTGTVKEVPAPARAGFGWTGPGPTDNIVAFQDKSTRGPGDSPIATRSWDFGDPGSGSANSASGRTPKHTFSAPGKYMVSLTVTDDNGLATTVTADVNVHAPTP